MTPVWGWGEISPGKGSPLLAVSFCPFPSLTPPHPHTKGAWWKGQFSTLENNFRERKFISYVNKIISICLEGLVQWVTELWDGTNLSASHSTTWAFLFFFFFHFNWTEIRWNENQGRGVQRKFKKQWTKTTERKNKFSYQSELSSRKIIHTICYYLLYAMKFPKRHFLIKQNIANADRPPWHRHSQSQQHGLA